MRKRSPNIAMRADPAFKKRFDEALEFKGWSMQTALERILWRWMDGVDRERARK